MDDFDNLPAPPDGYEGRWYSPRELRRVNRELARLGRRICRTHQGAALPLDDDHFYRNGEGFFDTECKDCKKARMVRNKRERWHRDEAFRLKMLDLKRADYAVNREMIRARRKRHQMQLAWRNS